MLGVLAGIWPSSLTPIKDRPYMRVVIDSPAGEIAFTVSKAAATRMWHVPEVTERTPDSDATRLRDQRLLQLATAFPPDGPSSSTWPPTYLRVLDRHSSRSGRED